MQLVDLLGGGLTATMILIIKLAMTPLLFYNMSWTFNGFKSILKGEAFPTPIYQSVVFLMCLGLTGFNFLTFLGVQMSSWSLPFSLTFLCVFFLANIIALLGNKYAASEGFERFYWMFKEGHIGVALRIADINRLDPEFAEETLALAETTLALRLAKRSINE